MKIVNVVILVALFTLAGCRTESELATLTANAPDDTPTQEIVPATATPRQIAPRVIIAPNGNANNVLPMSPICAGGSCRAYLGDFSGTVGFTSGWIEGNVNTCYALSASAIVDVKDNTCDNASLNYGFQAFMHFQDGSPASYAMAGMRSGTFDDINGKYELAWGIWLPNDGWFYPEVAFLSLFGCSNPGNNVIISDIWFRPAPDLGWCNGVGAPQ